MQIVLLRTGLAQMPEVNPWQAGKRLHRDRSPGKRAISEVWLGALAALVPELEPALVPE